MTTKVQDISGRSVFVTGADGFIGSHLVELLVQRGAKVRALVYYNSWNDTGWLSHVRPEIRTQFEVVNGDVRDPQQMRDCIREAEFVFHLASLIAIPYSYEAPTSYVQTNVIGTLNVLQACRDSGRLERMVHVSTSEVYGTAQHVPIAETHPLVGQSPYAATKIGADKLAESFHLSFGTPVVTARPFNTYGPRQTARAVIPTIASQLLAGINVLKLGSLTPTRDFNFVTDTARGMLALGLCADAVGRVVNIGSGEEWSIEQTAKLLMSITGRKVEIETQVERIRPESSEVNRLLADARLLRSLTNWAPEVGFESGLTLTVEWIRSNLGRFDASHYAR